MAGGGVRGGGGGVKAGECVGEGGSECGWDGGGGVKAWERLGEVGPGWGCGGWREG